MNGVEIFVFKTMAGKASGEEANCRENIHSTGVW